MNALDQDKIARYIAGVIEAVEADRDRWKADADRLTDAARKTVSGLSDAYPRGGMWPDPERESIRQQDAGALSAALAAHDALTADTETPA